jgi:hypothetical protein
VTVESPKSVDELDTKFRQLMQGYATALGDAQCVQRPRAGSVTRKAEEPKSVTSSADAYFGPLVRLLVGSHVRKRLTDLSSRFSQIEVTLSPDTEPVAYEWFSTRRALVEDVGSSLPPLKLPGVLVVISPVVTFLTAASDLPKFAWLAVLLFVMVPAMIAGRSLVLAYRRKRELFLEDASTVDRRSPEAQSRYLGRNYYRLEEELFSFLGSRARREMEVDLFTLSWGCLLLAELFFVVPLLLDSASTLVAVVGLVGGFTILFANVLLARRLPKRVWR